MRMRGGSPGNDIQRATGSDGYELMTTVCLYVVSVWTSRDKYRMGTTNPDHTGAVMNGNLNWFNTFGSIENSVDNHS
jgi:hypothetical protein